ncbi:hypothetical protein, partial [Draconibacterium sediminis]|uniref:hypothetical protein n=1 Tax=Draconibacterium sediminis TaxID=1544798 RepID=UPI0026EA0CEB
SRIFKPLRYKLSTLALQRSFPLCDSREGQIETGFDQGESSSTPDHLYSPSSPSLLQKEGRSAGFSNHFATNYQL